MAVERERKKITLDELIAGFEILSGERTGVLRKVDESGSPGDAKYRMYEEKSAINRMRALADAIETGKTRG